VAKRVHLTAEQTQCVAGQPRTVTVELSLSPRPVSGLSVRLVGGLPGYEAFTLGTDTDRTRMQRVGWCARTGTSHRWDRLCVSATGMARAITELEREAVQRQGPAPGSARSSLSMCPA
jgi:hypothetical protein